MEQARITKTQTKLREGGLPAPSSAADNMFLQSINGTICTACGEPIARLQGFYSVRIRSGELVPPLRLHPVCHDLWVRFTPAPLTNHEGPAPARS